MWDLSKKYAYKSKNSNEQTSKAIPNLEQPKLELGYVLGSSDLTPVHSQISYKA